MTKPGPKSLEFSNPEKYKLVRDALLAGTPAYRVHKQTGAGAGTVMKVQRALMAEGLLTKEKA